MFEWKIEYLPTEKILSLRSKGKLNVASANAMVKELVEAAERHQCLHHLIDHRETTFAFTFTDYYERPAVNAKLGISRFFKTAMIFPKLTKDTMFMENVFRNRGYNMRHFDDIDKALDWHKRQ